LIITSVFQTFEGVPQICPPRTVIIYWISQPNNTRLTTSRMSLEFWNQHLPGSEPFTRPCDSYEHSISSAASSSQSSVFSDVSAQSSIATSVSDDFRSSQEDLRERDRICAQPQLQYQAQTGKAHHGELNSAVAAHLHRNSTQAPPTYADVTSMPVAQRQHPRRCSVSRDRKPPQLVRQRDRKIDFVDNLVGKQI